MYETWQSQCLRDSTGNVWQCLILFISIYEIITIILDTYINVVKKQHQQQQQQLSILMLLHNINSSYNYDYSIDLYFSISLLFREYFFFCFYLTWKNKGDRIRSGLVGEIYFVALLKLNWNVVKGKRIILIIKPWHKTKRNYYRQWFSTFCISRDGIAHGTRGEVMRCRVNIWEANTINVMIIIIVIVLFYIFSTCTHSIAHEDNLCLGYWMQLLMFSCIFGIHFTNFLFSNYRNKFNKYYKS